MTGFGPLAAFHSESIQLFHADMANWLRWVLTAVVTAVVGQLALSFLLRVEQQSDSTAMGVATGRHMGTFEDDETVRSHDWLAKYFLPRTTVFGLSFSWLRSLAIANAHKKMPGAYPAVLARTLHFDRELVRLVQQENLAQFVVLGAG